MAKKDVKPIPPVYRFTNTSDFEEECHFEDEICIIAILDSVKE